MICLRKKYQPKALPSLRTVKDKIESDPILRQESHRQVYDRIRFELSKEDQNDSSIEEPVALLRESKVVKSRIVNV